MFVAFLTTVLLEEQTDKMGVDDSLSWDEPNTVPVTLGTIANRYVLQHELGAGGMGAVYSAVDLKTQETVAVKIMGSDRSDSRKARFVREASATLSVEHPNIVRLLDFGVGARHGYFQVLELLVGDTLAVRMNHGEPMGTAEIISTIRPVLAALEVAHARGLVHRDLKPENIFLAHEEEKIVPKLIDFGMARDLSDCQGITSAGSLLGTPLYMAPEQLAGNAVGPAVDYWALGVIVYQLVCQRYPFRARDVLSLYEEQLRGFRPLPYKHVLEPFVRQCLTQDPRKRLEAPTLFPTTTAPI